MIVEDDLILNLLYESYLEKLGYGAEGELVYGKTAIEIAKRIKPDLILMDMGLPDCSGEELAARLQRLDDDPPPMVALSGHEFSSAQRARSIFSDHLLKPVNMELIRSALEKAVDKNVNKEKGSQGCPMQGSL